MGFRWPQLPREAFRQCESSHVHHATEVPQNCERLPWYARPSRLRLSKPNATAKTTPVPLTKRAPLSVADELEWHYQVALLFYTAALPYRLIENPEFRRMLLRDREHLTLPTRAAIASDLLEMAFKREKQTVIAALKTQQRLALVSDGWTNTNSEGIINFVMCSPTMRPMLWSSISAQDNAHTSEYMAGKIPHVIAEIEKETGLKVSSVVTDNAANMKHMWDLIREKHPKMICNGCAAHAINLMIKDTFKIDIFSDVLTKATAVVRFVRKRQSLLARFRKEQRARHHAKTKRRAGTKLDNVLAIMEDAQFWVNADITIKIMAPMTSSLGVMERDSCCLSMVYHHFKLLRECPTFREAIPGLDPKVQASIRTIVSNRWDFIKSKSLFVAYLLDQSKLSTGFATGDYALATDYAEDMLMTMAETTQFSFAFEDAVFKFVNMKDGWPLMERERHARKVSINWWSTRSDMPLMQDLALQLFSVPTSSAASERAWSIMGHIHTKIRNRLSVESVRKLAFIYSNKGEKTSKKTPYNGQYPLGDSEQDEESDNDAE